MKIWDDFRAKRVEFWDTGLNLDLNVFSIQGADCRDIETVKNGLREIFRQHAVVDISAMVHGKDYNAKDILFEALSELAKEEGNGKINSSKWLEKNGILRLVQSEACEGGYHDEYVTLGALMAMGHNNAKNVASSASPFFTFKFLQKWYTGYAYSDALKLSWNSFCDDMEKSWFSLSIYNKMVSKPRTAEEAIEGTLVQFSYRDGINLNHFSSVANGLMAKIKLDSYDVKKADVKMLLSDKK
jgi:hypothetical protein